jgi:hypothetical protein
MESFTAHRQDGKIVLELDEQRFLSDAAHEAADNLQVVDREQFLEFALKNLFTLTHDIDRDGVPTSWWLRLTGALGKAAAATNAGVRTIYQEVPTCGCDPEEHDGG